MGKYIIHKRVKELRKSHNWTQKRLAEAIGVSPVSIQRFEYGTLQPSLDSIIKFALIFDVSIDYLVGLTENPAKYWMLSEPWDLKQD